MTERRRPPADERDFRNQPYATRERGSAAWDGHERPSSRKAPRARQDRDRGYDRDRDRDYDRDYDRERGRVRSDRGARPSRPAQERRAPGRSPRARGSQERMPRLSRNGAAGFLAQLPPRIRLVALVVLVVIVAALGIGIARGCAKTSEHKAAPAPAQTKQPAPTPDDEPALATTHGTIDPARFDYERAKQTGAKNPKKELQEILANPSQYPTDMLAGLAFNPELLNYVYDYPAERGKKAAQTVGNATVVHNNIPHFLQFDERWGYVTYGNSPFGISGCGPTCVSMVAVGLTGNKDITPAAVGEYAEKHEMKSDEGTSWTLMSTGCKKFGIEGTQLKSVTQASIKQALKKGPVIASMKPGDFTTMGHFIVLTGITPNGYLTLNDPNSLSNTNSNWTLERVVPQIKVAWSMKKL